MKTSGIGGQAVIEGIMMRNKDKYAIAVRKPDKEIELLVKNCHVVSDKFKWLKLPIIRGIVSFVDSFAMGISTINYSASFYDDSDEQKQTKADEIGKKIFKDKLESVLMALTIILSVVFAVTIFMLLPFYASRMLGIVISSKIVLNIMEGVIRVLLFLLYVYLISRMNDIKRTFMYHGAEHKCINCIEHGARLTPENVKNSSRLHKRCGTSFMFLVMFVSVIFFIFIRVENTALQMILRILLVPVIAGVSYEILRWAGRKNGVLVNIISKPGLWIQKLTTKEPDMDMIEVAIQAVEAVFDWEAFLVSYYKGAENMDELIAVAEKKLEQRALRERNKEEAKHRKIKTSDEEAQSAAERIDAAKREEREKVDELIEDLSRFEDEDEFADENSVLEGFEFEEDLDLEKTNIPTVDASLHSDIYKELAPAAEEDGIDESFEQPEKMQADSDISNEAEIPEFEDIDEDDDIDEAEVMEGIEFVEDTIDDVFADDVPVFKKREKK